MSLKDGEGKITDWINSFNLSIYNTYFISRSYINYIKSRPSTVDIEDNTYESQSNESNEENNTPKLKKQKVNKTMELEQMLIQMSHRILNYMEKKVSSVDDAFMEFIKIQLNNIPEKEKNIRRKMIMDALTEPLPKK